MIGQSLSARRFVVAVLSVLLADQAYPEDQRSEAIYVGGQQKEVEKTAFDLGMWLGALYSVELSGSQDEVIAAYRRAAELANMLDIDMPMPPLGERSTERAIQGLIFTVDLSNSLSGQLFKRYGRRPVAAFFFSLTTIQARVMSADTKTQRTLLEKAITASVILELSDEETGRIVEGVQKGMTLDKLLRELDKVRNTRLH